MRLHRMFKVEKCIWVSGTDIKKLNVIGHIIHRPPSRTAYVCVMENVPASNLLVLTMIKLAKTNEIISVKIKNEIKNVRLSDSNSRLSIASQALCPLRHCRAAY